MRSTLKDTPGPLVRAWVNLEGKTLTQVALDAGLPPASCRIALRTAHYAGEAAIARFLGKAPEDLWPLRLADRAERKNKARQAAAHREKRSAS
ncbi:helix-turn-helix domain-containing protein [Inquilinus sp.]|jgi:lambda repressor-like predicted transcriptional regulator|uniref:helix-turn-helix domain-containing protein n=1 Tax=Inquilinus sp. TaxID=1932117 RepID=UPI003784ED82